jgi:hypothetical protein
MAQRLAYTADRTLPLFVNAPIESPTDPTFCTVTPETLPALSTVVAPQPIATPPLPADPKALIVMLPPSELIGPGMLVAMT